MIPDLEGAEVLIAVDEHGSIGAAARHLGITQPAASARLRTMEARWGLALVERSARGSRLTDAGQAVAGWGRAAFERVAALQAGLEALQERHDRGLRVAASLTVAGYLVPRWLGELRARYPAATPQLMVVNSAAVIGLVHDGTADLGFIETPDLPPDLAVRRIGEDALVVVAHPSHPWAHRDEPVATDELAAEPLVLREPGSGTRRTFEAALGSAPTVALEASSTASLVGAVIAGIAPGVVSERAVTAAVQNGELVPVATTMNARRPLSVVWSRERRLSRTAEALVAIATAGSATMKP
ncbi:LysR family transcriptional regulator [Aeromicrobium phragmitis]|uniref:LysR family transcriptional regulator n=1 Tax=Aeromicrobium phragmitis TaxID=2478914 RepID=A0A3L8PI28_9ACTN|nr:LysR family transcriptional regulator [Aeromicrobium phragmitis]RLV54881.1 LysR family transcriptional regulator [Aeromicrobium phragmitis]